MLPTSLWICMDSSATALTAPPADRLSTSASILVLTDLQNTSCLRGAALTSLSAPQDLQCHAHLLSQAVCCAAALTTP